jgi:homoserine acetyltransferase
VVVNPQAIPPALQRKVFANLISDVSYRVLLQMKDWAENNAFRSFDRSRDYRAGIQGLSLPLLVMGGSADRLAPPACVKAQFELPRSGDKTLMIFGRENGDRLDYGHGDLLYGAEAPREVYPKIRAWLESHATRA